MNKKITVIMIGGKSHNGKGTFADKLYNLLEQTNKNIIRCSLSTYIRDITKNDFFWNGEDSTEARKFMGEVYRLATELIYPYHMARRVWERDIIPNLKEDNIVIIESLREKNNLDYFEQLKEQGLINKIITIKVIRPGYNDIDKSQQTHVSETDLDNYEFDHYIYNDKTPKELSAKALDLLDVILDEHTNIKEIKDIDIPSTVKITKINDISEAIHLTRFIGKEGVALYNPITYKGIKRWKIIFNFNTIHEESAYFRRNEFEVVE